MPQQDLNKKKINQARRGASKKGHWLKSQNVIAENEATPALAKRCRNPNTAAITTTQSTAA
jgi:hypothetical protein